MTEPKHNKGKSRQDVGTPRDFLDAVERRFGCIKVDLAARADNAVAPLFVTPEEDSLVVPWGERFPSTLAWLNPEFSDIAPWAAKCAHEAGVQAPGLRVLLLTPASVGAVWFAEHVHRKALVLALSPRIKFIGHKTGFPKDLILSCFGFGAPGFELWRWK